MRCCRCWMDRSYVVVVRKRECVAGWERKERMGFFEVGDGIWWNAGYGGGWEMDGVDEDLS